MKTGRERAVIWIVAFLTLAVVGHGQEPEQAAKERAFLVATDFPSIQDAIAALPYGGGTVCLPPGTHVLKQTLNLTKALRGHWFAVNLRGAGRFSTFLVLDTGGDPGIDLSGNAMCEVSDMSIRNKTANCGILLSRDPAGSGGCLHVFRSLHFEGAFPVSAIYSIGGEVNRYYDCHIGNQLPKHYQKDIEGMEAGDAFIFAGSNIRGVKSPYVEGNQGGCNTEMTMVGCTVSNQGRDSVGLRVVGHAGDVRVYGSYFHSDGFSAIYLDGTRAEVSNVGIRDCRIEGEDGVHCLYAKGHCRNVTVDTGGWFSGAGEPILQEDAPSFGDEGYAADTAGVAHGWNVRGIFFSIWDGIDLTRKAERPRLYPFEERGYYAIMRFDRVQFSNLECKSMHVIRHRLDEEGKLQSQAVYGPDVRKGIVVEKMSKGNTFVVLEPPEVLLKGERKGRNAILALASEEPPQQLPPQAGPAPEE